MQLKHGPPKTLAQQMATGIEFREDCEASNGGGAAPMELDSADAANEEFARRLQAKMDAQEVATARRG